MLCVAVIGQLDCSGISSLVRIGAIYGTLVCKFRRPRPFPRLFRPPFASCAYSCRCFAGVLLHRTQVQRHGRLPKHRHDGGDNKKRLFVTWLYSGKPDEDCRRCCCCCFIVRVAATFGASGCALFNRRRLLLRAAACAVISRACRYFYSMTC